MASEKMWGKGQHPNCNEETNSTFKTGGNQIRRAVGSLRDYGSELFIPARSGISRVTRQVRVTR